MAKVMAHPNKNNKQRYRVYDRELRVNEYISIARHGEEKAHKIANDLAEKFNKKKKNMALRRELSINQIFNSDGTVKGLKRISAKRNDRKTYDYLKLGITIGHKKHYYREWSLRKRKFEDAYKLVQDAILEARKIDRTPEISMMFKKAKRHYW